MTISEITDVPRLRRKGEVPGPGPQGVVDVGLLAFGVAA